MWANTALRTLARMFGNRGGVGTRGLQLAAPRRRRPHFDNHQGVAHDRLDRSSFLRPFRAGGCAALVFIVGLFASLTSADVFAYVTTPKSVATAQCAAHLAATGPGNSDVGTYSCVDKPESISPSNGEYLAYVCFQTATPGYTYCSSLYGYGVDDTAQPNQCASHASPSSTVWSGGLAEGSTMCADSCTFAFHQTPGTINISTPDGGGQSNGTYTPTGASCTAGGSVPPPSSNTPTAPCSGGSCYDTSSNKFCSTNGSGVQTCIAGPKDGGSSPPVQASACSVNGVNGICASASSATPPVPPNPPVSDPAKQQTGTGNFTASNAAGATNITTTVYTGSSSSGTGSGGSGGTGSGGTGSGGTGTGSGDGGTGDDGDGDCTAGPACKDAYTGAACGSDPSTAGDPLLSQVAVEAHRSNCFRQGIADEIGSGDKTTGKEADLADLKDDDGGDGVISLNEGGFLGGRGTCPGFQPVEYLGYNIMNSDGICDTAPFLAGFVLFAAYVSAGLIVGLVISGKS